MTKLQMLIIKSVAVFALLSSVSFAGAATNLNRNQALASLMSGNSSFVAGNFSYLSKVSQRSYREAASLGQTPYAVVLGCIDSRVPPEIIFDKGINEIFSTRIAGNVIADHELGSIEYAVEHSGVPLVMVLGHSKCGAVTSSVDYAYSSLLAGTIPVGRATVPSTVPPIVLEEPPLITYVNSLVNSLLNPIEIAYVALTPVTTPPTPPPTKPVLVEAAIKENVIEVVDKLIATSLIISEGIVAGKVMVVGAEYDVFTGKVTILKVVSSLP